MGGIGTGWRTQDSLQQLSVPELAVRVCEAVSAGRSCALDIVLLALEVLAVTGAYFGPRLLDFVRSRGWIAARRARTESIYSGWGGGNRFIHNHTYIYNVVIYMYMYVHILYIYMCVYIL